MRTTHAGTFLLQNYATCHSDIQLTVKVIVTLTVTVTITVKMLLTVRAITALTVLIAII